MATISLNLRDLAARRGTVALVYGNTKLGELWSDSTLRPAMEEAQ